MYELLITLGDVEIKLLKARLEQTEKALERIVAQMGSVTNRLVNSGNMRTFHQVITAVIFTIYNSFFQHHGNSCCNSPEETHKEEKVTGLMKNSND